MNPNVAAAVNAVVGVLGVLAVMKPEMFPGYVPGSVATDVIQTAGFSLAVWGGVNTGLHLTSPPTAGALGSKP